MSHRKLSVALVLTGWLMTPSAYAQNTDEFTVAWQKFGESYSKLNQVNDSFTKQVAPHMATFTLYRTWMEDTTKVLSANTVSEQDLTLAFKQYRDFLKDDTTCSSASLQTLQQDLQASLSELKSGLVDLKGIATAQISSPKKIRLQMAASIGDAEKATAKAELIVSSYAESLGSSNICLTMSNYDLILVASETLFATQGRPTPLFLGSYLSNKNTEQSPEQIKLEAKAYLEAVVQSFRTNLQAGHIAKTLILLNRLEGNIAFGTSAIKRLSEAERQEFENLKVQTKLALKDLTMEFDFPRFEGLEEMVKEKTLATYRRLTALERETIRASDQAVFAKVKDYCEINLGMKVHEPYRMPKFKNLEEVLNFEAKISEVQYQLKALEKSRELASR